MIYCTGPQILGVISMNHALFSKMEEADFQRLENEFYEVILCRL